MIKLLEFLWSGCFHEWETITVKEMVSTTNQLYMSGKEYETKKEYVQYTLRCKKCGNIKQVNVGV